MFAHIVVGIGLLVGVVVTLEASIWHMLLVLAPRDTLQIQKVGEGRDIRWDIMEEVFAVSILAMILS